MRKRTRVAQGWPIKKSKRRRTVRHLKPSILDYHRFEMASASKHSFIELEIHVALGTTAAYGVITPFFIFPLSLFPLPIPYIPLVLLLHCESILSALR